MNQIPPAESIDTSRWDLIFLITSLDSARPFFADMGLRIQEEKRLQEVIRSAMQEHMARLTTSGKTHSATHAERQQAMQRILDAVEKELGQDAVQTYLTWGNNTFQNDPAATADLFVWRSIFHVLASPNGAGYTKAPLDLGIPHQESVIECVMASHQQQQDLRVRFQETIAGQKSAWDQAMEKVYGADSQPTDWVLETALAQHTRKLLQDLHRSLPPTEQETLLTWARQQAAYMDMPPNLVQNPFHSLARGGTP